jgi:hypothetical protein
MIAFRLFLVARLRSTAAEGVKVRSDIFSLPSVASLPASSLPWIGMLEGPWAIEFVHEAQDRGKDDD